MNDIQIGVVSTDHETSKLIRDVAQKRRLDIKLREGILDEGVLQAHQLERENVDVIISRGTTGRKIKKETSLPVVIIEISAFDILKALDSAKKTGPKIAFLGNTKDFGPEFESITRILEIDVECYPYDNIYEMDKQISRILKLDIDVVVSTGLCVFEIAKKSGMEAILVQSGYEAVDNAMKRALELIQNIRREQELSRKFRSVLELSNDGIFIVDENERISFINHAAETLLKVDAAKIAGRKAHDFNNGFLSPLLNNYQEEGAFKKVGRKQFWVDSAPIVAGNGQGSVVVFQSADRIRVLEQKYRHQLFEKRLVAKHQFENIIGESSLIKEAIEKAKKFASTDATVLITGENGTGKELFAHSIHSEGGRSEGPFVAVNCAALPENLLESELFGYEEGAFTGAKKGGKIGLFEMAHQGTIFLDEIGEMSLPLQARLLRVLQEREIMRIGSDRVIPVDVRIIAATNCDLGRAVNKGVFRNDLYHRLEVLDLEVPPLRKRKQDIGILADFFKERINCQTKKMVPDLNEQALEQLQKYNWPGNVRELYNVMEKYVILIEENDNPAELTKELISEKIRKSFTGKPGDGGTNTINIEIGNLDNMERQIFEYLLSTGASVKELAEILGTSRTTIWRKLKNFETAN